MVSTLGSAIFFGLHFGFFILLPLLGFEFVWSFIYVLIVELSMLSALDFFFYVRLLLIDFLLLCSCCNSYLSIFVDFYIELDFCAFRCKLRV